MPEILPPYPIETPEYMPGMAISVQPPTSQHLNWTNDYGYYDQLGRDPLQVRRVWGISDPEARVEALEAVLKDYSNMTHRRKILFRAAVRNDEAIVRHLLNAGVRVHPGTRETKENEEKEKDVDISDPDLPGEEDVTCIPYHVAAVHGKLGCLKIFVESGVEVDARDDLGRTAFLAAAGSNRVEVMKYLLEQGADPTARNTESDLAKKYLGMYSGADALEYIANRGNIEVMEMLLGKPGVTVTPLAIKSAANGSHEGLRLMLKHAGLAPFEDKTGNQIKNLPEAMNQAIIEATELAILNGDLPSIKLLLSYQYPTDKKGNISFSPIPKNLYKPIIYGAYDAVEKNYPDKFEWIHSLGLKEHETMSLDGLPEGQLINIQHLFDDCAKHGSTDCARLLIEQYGANPNKYRTPPCAFPLYWAAGNDKPDFVRFLLEEHNVDIHVGSGRYATGPTALWAAITLKSFESIKLLLQHGGPFDYIDEEFSRVYGIINAVLIAQCDGKVEFHTEANAEEWIEGQKSMWERPNSRYVRVIIGPEDKDWLEKLQIRRSDEELREHGEGARELDGKEASETPTALQRQLPDYPTAEERAEELNSCCDDLIPAFIPAYTMARKRE